MPPYDEAEWERERRGRSEIREDPRISEAGTLVGELRAQAFNMRQSLQDRINKAKRELEFLMREHDQITAFLAQDQIKLHDEQMDGPQSGEF